MQQNLPRGGQVVVVGPGGGGESVVPVAVAQDDLVVEHLVGAPLAAEQVGEIVEVHTEVQGLLVAVDIEVDLLRNLEVDAVHPRHFAAVALGILASVLAEVGVAADELLEGGAVLFRCERHRR